MITLTADPKLGNMNGWQERHNAAISTPHNRTERAIVGLIRAWAEYADAHKQANESTIGQDGFLRQHWGDIGLDIIGLLNGSTGGNRIDCGTLDAAIRRHMEANNCSSER